MKEKETISKKTVDPVIEQKIIKEKHRNRLLWWLLPLIIILLLLFWFNHHQKQINTAPAMSENSETATATGQQNSVNTSTGNTVDKINAWFTGDKSNDRDWIALDSLSFNSGSATPDMNDDKRLQQIADILNKNPDQQVLIRGFADSTGTPALNNNLSTERANAVRQWFIQHQVAPERIQVNGQGATAPVASNDTQQGREQNRRVALKILAKKAGE